MWGQRWSGFGPMSSDPERPNRGSGRELVGFRGPEFRFVSARLCPSTPLRPTIMSRPITVIPAEAGIQTCAFGGLGGTPLRGGFQELSCSPPIGWGLRGVRAWPEFNTRWVCYAHLTPKTAQFPHHFNAESISSPLFVETTLERNSYAQVQFRRSRAPRS
jgi:hypothetical protein